MFETNVVVIHNDVPQISLTHSSFLRSRPRSSGRHDDVCILATPTSPLLLLLSSRDFVRVEFLFLREEKKKIGVFEKKREENTSRFLSHKRGKDFTAFSHP